MILLLCYGCTFGFRRLLPVVRTSGVCGALPRSLTFCNPTCLAHRRDGKVHHVGKSQNFESRERVKAEEERLARDRSELEVESDEGLEPLDL